MMCSSSLMLWGCVSLQTTAASIPTSTQQTTPSPTFYFPTLIPTATSTSAPTSSPTPSTSLGIGNLLFFANFESSQSWDLRETDRGGSSIYDGQLNLAVRQPNSFFFTRTPAPEQDDFYFEVDIRSDVCEDGDEYGIMFRLGPLYNHYRFSLTCDGFARVSRILDDQEVVLIPPTETYAVFPGQRIGNHLAVWASGIQFRFFINDIEVFSIQDRELEAGGFGLFVRSRRSQQTTVSFDDVALYAIQALPTATVNP
ncbi:MAG: hypothetical protein P8Z42_13865 [Anaerolineales bacterium]